LHYQRADYRAALADHQAAAERDPDDAGTLNFIAWIQATCPQDDLRNGPAALAASKRVCEMTQFTLPGYLDTLAAAHAECGEFEQAAQWQEKAISLVPEESRADYASRLALYRANTPYRELNPDT
jgi:tetratricopeptide (TPR) repeat protein